MLFEDIQKVQNHFQLLFQRLKFLEEACGIDLQNPSSQETSMVEIQTSFGEVKINRASTLQAPREEANSFESQDLTGT